MTVVTVSQSHHDEPITCRMLLLLQKQHCTVIVTLVPVNLVKKQRRDTLFITAVHLLFSHCSVASTHDEVMISELLL